LIIRRKIREFIASICGVGIRILRKYSQRKSQNVVILMYHRVLKPAEDMTYVLHPGIYVTPSTFEMQMRYLKQCFNVISFEDYLNVPYDAHTQSKTRCIVTFDDGWKDNYENAFPVLKKYEISATVFLSTGFVGTDKWFWQQKLGCQIKTLLNHPQLLAEIDREKSGGVIADILKVPSRIRNEPERYLDSIIRKLKLNMPDKIEEIIKRIEIYTGLNRYPSVPQILNKKEIAEMSERGIYFGSHGISHRVFTALESSVVDAELRDSRRFIENEGYRFIPVLSYPNGDFNEEIINRAQRWGYRAGVTTMSGVNMHGGNLFKLRRINIHEDVSHSKSLFSYLISSGEQW